MVGWCESISILVRSNSSVVDVNCARILLNEFRKLKVDKLSADIKPEESKVRVEVGRITATSHRLHFHLPASPSRPGRLASRWFWRRSVRQPRMEALKRKTMVGYGLPWMMPPCCHQSDFLRVQNWNYEAGLAKHQMMEYGKA